MTQNTNLAQRGHVLLIGGASRTGKTTIAKAIAREHRIAWVQVDDLRLAMQWSNVQLPTSEETEAICYFERTPDIWSKSATELRDALISVGNVLEDAISIVIGNHNAQNDSAIIEGDAILPAIRDRRQVGN